MSRPIATPRVRADPSKEVSMHRSTLSRTLAPRLAAPALLALALVGCAGPGSGKTSARETEWLEPSPYLREQIDQQAQRLPWVHGMEERVAIIQWFASVGEPAYPTLLELVLDPRPDVSGAALAALGATRDARLVEPLRSLPWPSIEDEDLALERARTLLYLGDWSMAEHLIVGLRDERPYTRALCIKALADVTKERFGYEASAPDAERETAVQRWESWWHSRNVDPMAAGARK
jgi:hypothetical protein